MNKIRESRKERGMTQEDLARKSGLSIRTIMNIEHDKPCRQDSMQRIMKALEIPSLYSLFFTGGLNDKE